MNAAERPTGNDGKICPPKYQGAFGRRAAPLTGARTKAFPNKIMLETNGETVLTEDGDADGTPRRQVGVQKNGDGQNGHLRCPGPATATGPQHTQACAAPNKQKGDAVCAAIG